MSVKPQVTGRKSRANKAAKRPTGTGAEDGAECRDENLTERKSLCNMSACVIEKKTKSAGVHAIKSYCVII